MAEEENFPRGGRIVGKRPHQDNQNLFSIAKPSKSKKQKKSKKQDAQESSENVFQLKIQGSLTYNKMQTGMVILGCVRHITNLAMEVELPGLCFASVNITDISDPFTKYLNQLLENNEPETNNILSRMFSIGEFLPVKIISIEERDKGTHVEASINPRQIYAEQNHNSFKKDMLVWACVSSQADHGYEMSMGVKNCRAFLPSKNVNNNTEYGIGKPLWCVVHKFEATSTASIVRLSAKTEHIKSPKLDIENLHSIIPGMKVEFVSDKVVAHGIQGKFSEHFIGYVDEAYLSKPLKKLTEHQEGKILTAYVLFVEPTTKITHLSLRFPEKEERPELNTGKIVQGEVFSRGNNGYFFILPNKLKGFVTNKRLINTLAKKDNMNISESLNSKLPIGSKHQCRIMDYNHISKTFICTPEFSVVKENTFAPTDLTPGQLVNVSIVTIKDEGFVVTTGLVRGFVPNLHISNMQYTINVKKRFKEGQKLNARVLVVEEDKVLFTLKPALVENEECLTKIEDAEIRKKYAGVVSKLSDNGALIVFYGNVKGWIGQKGMGNEVTEPSKYFFIGQVANIYVWRLEISHIYLSLFRPQVKSSLPNVGGRYIGIVKSVNEDGLNIQLENTHRRGFVPNVHLSNSLSLGKAVKNTFSPGDKIPDLLYIGGIKPQIFSRREGLAMNTKRVPTLGNLEVGDIIRCSYQSSSDKGVYVLPLIQDWTEPVLINHEDIDSSTSQLVQHQLIMAKIKKLHPKNKELILSINLTDVYDKTVESTIDLFSQYLLESSNLYRYAKKQKWDVCKYSPGDKVTCKVDKIGPQGGCVVLLPQGGKGIAVPSLCPKSVKEGDHVVGMVLAHDYEQKFVDLCLKPEIFERINTLQDGNINQPIASSMTQKLLVKDECIISILKHPDGNKQLIYLPTKLHYNDFEGCTSYYDKKKTKICVCGKLKKFLIGMSKTLFLRLDKAANKNKVDSKSLVKTEDKRKIKKLESDKISKKEKRQKLTKTIEAMEVDECDEASESDSGIEQEENNQVEVETESEDETESLKSNTIDKIVDKHQNSGLIALPGVSSFFNAHKKEPVVEDSSSEDEDNGPTEKKKKKLSPAERADLLRQEEERISKIEKELADPTKAPESAEQFDRLLLSKPDSAELWAKYIAFHIAATEIDKARAVTKRALDTINMTLTEEKFKIWIVLLNLENMFGTKESFDKSFEDALKFNDSLQVYLKVIQMLAENAKYTEMEEKISKVRAKHRQDPVMWLEVGKTYYQIGNFKEARNCKDRALKSISDKKSQMTIIVRFAIMEFKYGEQDQGCAIFETILTSDPRKVNIWVTYVDQLIKKELIEEARRVLERSVCQKLPLKNMKSLFMKFRKFEEVHGNPETVEAVKQRAQDYVAKFEK